MSLPCVVVKDLIPLYQEELCSEETKQLVKEHLEECQSCKIILDDLNEDTFDLPKMKDVEIDEVAVNVLKGLKHKMRKTNILFGIASFCITIIMLYTVTLFDQLIHYFSYTLIIMILFFPVFIVVRNGFLYQKSKGNFKQYYKVFWKKEVALALFVVYNIALSFFILRRWLIWGRSGWPLMSRLNLIPFDTILTYIRYPQAFNIDIIIRNTIGKILVMVPLGILIPYIWEGVRLKKMICIFTIIVVLIQTTRLFLGGIADIDTVILNGIGVALGYSITKLLRKS